MIKTSLIKLGLAASMLLFASAASLADTVNLTAAPTQAVLPDGQAVPMWGYSCGTVDASAGSATCAASNPNAGANWSPVVIRVPSGTNLTINLTNNLSFAAGAGTNAVPTSLVIVGQLGGGLGSAPMRVPSPVHAPQGTTWPGTLGTTNPGDPVFTPPAQPDRVRSFATEVAASATTPLTWNNLRAGTYLIQSGTQPSIQGPMGLYGVLVVTDATYPGQTFDNDATLLLSEIDPLQNTAVDTAVRTAGFSDALVWSGQTGKCGDPTVHTCYPPAVNYDPRYFLINGTSFDRSNSAASALPVPASATQGRVLLRFVNAGLRMHVPSVVGANMALLAEDGNKLPGVPKVQSSLFLAAGKTYDVTIQPKQTTPGTYDAATYAVFDRSLGLSTNNQRDGGMQVQINVNGGAAPLSVAASAVADTYYLVAGNVLGVAEPAKGLIANDTGVYGVQLLAAPTGAGSTLSLNADGTFTYTPGAGVTSDSFTYCANGTVTGATCSSGITATVTLAPCAAGCLGAAPTANADSYSSTIASRLQISTPGVLQNDRDPSGLPLKAVLASVGSCASVELNADGSFTATSASGVPCSFTYNAVNSQNTASAAAAAVALSFPVATGLNVAVKDAKSGAAITDYRWIIEEDRTVFIDPAIESSNTAQVRNVAVNFYTSHMPVVAQGCVGTISCEDGQTLLSLPAVCDVGNGACRPGTQKAEVNPSQVALDPTKRYYLSILPGDGWITDDAAGGHTMGGAQIAAGQTTVDVNLQRTPLQPAKISVFVFQDDNPLNGEVDTGGGVDVLAPNEAGLGDFNLVLLDQAGAFGDPAGQITYDMFGMPVSNSLAGTIDRATGLNACPIAKNPDRLVGVIPVCPKYEANLDGTPTTVLSPLAGHALIDNLYAGLYEVMASPGADRFARGEEWLQTNTLDGTKAIEAFIKPGEPGYFQEFGPGGYHITFGFANPKIINNRKASVCANQTCTATINGMVTGLRMSRTPDQRVYSSGSYDTYSFAQCYVSLGSPDAADFAFTKCNPDGTFQFTGIPKGNMKVTVFDQWNDLLVDGLSTPIKVDGESIGTPTQPLEIAVTQWRTNLYGRVFIDQNGDGVSQESEPGLPLVPFNIRARDGSYFGFNNTDMGGYAGFNEVFPILNWLVVDTDSARYKLAGVHVVYDAGGPVDGTTGGGTSAIAAGLANTIESPTAHLPPELRVPGARYCASADCPAGDTAGGSTGRVDPGWASSQGWQGLLGNNGFIEFAMKPFIPGENGGIKGHVIYTSTRPFDDPALLLQLSWEPGVANVKINLYQEGTAADGTKSLKLVDTTMTSSWDAWAQGFRKDASGNPVLAADGKPIPNMNCPGQETTSPFYYTLENSTQTLDPNTPLAYNSRFKCYDGWSMLTQIQPAPYDGMYKFPSIVGRNTTTGAPEGSGTAVDPAGGSQAGTNCTICVANPDDGTPMLPAGKYVVEVIVPSGYELVKEEDKNILLGDAYIAPVTQQFAGFGNIFIMPDQAAMNAFYNPTNQIQSTTNNGAVPRREGDTGSVEVFWPCVGEKRIVPDLNSLFPGAGQAAPFAGATRPLCDRKEVTLEDQMAALAKFYVFNSTHIAAHYTGTITNDFASEFDPFSPQFGEKFAVPNTPVAVRDFAGKEVSRIYSDQWGAYNGLNYSSYTVNPPSPSGYIPQMMIMCMNDPGPIMDTRAGSPTNGQMITDPAYNPAYSNFCYEWPFMPGQTAYLDTPVIPTMAFADRYNLPDCEYPDTTPAIKSVLGSSIGGGSGPWVSGPGQTLTINALGDKTVINHAYSGPRATQVPYNQKFITRHYGFGSRPSTCPTSGACPNATIAGVPMTNVTTWTDTQIIGNVPNVSPTQSTCTLIQRTSPASIGQSARCGQLEITAANGKKSIDSITVTIAGKPPVYVTPASPSNNLFGRLEPSPLQTAIDNAAPGDLILVGPGIYKESLLMWKPVRLQGVGAASVTINADAHPAGKLDAWRRQAVCLFGLTAEGRPASAEYAGCPLSMFARVDRIPLEGIVGWDTTLNGNLAEQLQEPTLMGAYEGAGVTVLARGVRVPVGTTPDERFGVGVEGAFPAGHTYLTSSNADCTVTTNANQVRDARDYGTGNFMCNPSRIDGVSIINSSQGGGAIFAHGWNHNLEIANTRISANHGTLTGGITVGTPEFPDPFIVLAPTDPEFVPLPIPVPNGTPVGTQLGYAIDKNVRVHHNSVTSNASIGDALYSGTPSAAGGVSFVTGSDNYQLRNNWICGNLSTGDGGGVVHSGFINDGTIANNWILFNQSASPTIPTNGGGLAVLGASPDRLLVIDGVLTECGSTTDQDCPPGLPEGTGRNLLIDGNLIMGNSAESGTGGGLRLQMVNGEDVVAFPNGPDQRLGGPQALRSPGWNNVTVTNNIIANNVAGWDGGGVSMQDALKVAFVNNTVISNDTTASAGVLFNTLGAPNAAVPPPGCTPTTDPNLPQNPNCINPVTTSTNQVSGLVTMQNTPNLIAALPANTAGTQMTCPAGYGYGTGTALNDGSCRDVSLPLLRNNLFWKNRAFHVEVGNLGTDQQNQQAVVTLVPSLNQTATGFCATIGTDNGAPGSGGSPYYWDIGVRGDTSSTPNSGSGFVLSPMNSILTNAASYPGANNLGSDPAVLRQYCNGSRLPPEGGGLFSGFNAPPGRSETTGLYPVFALNQITPAATVDEGNNWINLGYGPLSVINAATAPGTGVAQVPLGDYSISVGSPAVNTASPTGAPNHDICGHPRPSGAGYDIGAFEVSAGNCNLVTP
ncbi:MAG: Ig-like domain-containing protein [Sulfuricella sp.]